MAGQTLPSADVMRRLRASASLSAKELDARVATTARMKTSPAIWAAAGALVDHSLRRNGKKGPEAMRSAATALGAGYAAGRVILGDPAARQIEPARGAREMLRQLRRWDQDAVHDAAGTTLETVRARIDALLEVTAGSRSSTASDRATTDALFSAGLGLAIAEADGGASSAGGGRR